MKFLPAEILLHEGFRFTFTCVTINMAAYKKAPHGLDQVMFAVRFQHFNNVIWYNQETRVSTITN